MQKRAFRFVMIERCTHCVPHFTPCSLDVCTGMTCCEKYITHSLCSYFHSFLHLLYTLLPQSLPPFLPPSSSLPLPSLPPSIAPFLLVFPAIAMSSKIPLPVVTLVVLVSTIYLICSMVLFSSIIAWISLEFSTSLAAPLAFIVGVLSLIAAIVGILMEGVARIRRCLGFTFLVLTVALILTTIGLLVPFVLIYNGGNTSLIGEICGDCDDFGKRTQTCVDDCLDECCFTDMSEPLVILLGASTGLSLVASVIGLGTAIAHLFFAFRLPSNSGKRL